MSLGRTDRRYSRTLRRLPLVGPPSRRYGVAAKAYPYTGGTSCLLGHQRARDAGCRVAEHVPMAEAC
jgi:hypothetical protein